MPEILSSTQLAHLHEQSLDQPLVSEDFGLVSDVGSTLSDAFQAECNNLRCEHSLAASCVEEALEYCASDLHEDFLRRRSEYADIDVLTLVTDGKLDFCEEHHKYEAYKSLLEIAVSRSPLTALQTMTEGEKDYFLRGVLVIRMGPGTYNFAHPHGRQFTANILLRDVSRERGSVDGMYFVHYHPKSGQPYPNPYREDLRVGPKAYQRIFPTEPGMMNARKPNVYHGVMPVAGNRELQPRPESCRYALTYVLEKLRKSPAL